MPIARALSGRGDKFCHRITEFCILMSPPEGLGDILFFPGRPDVRLAFCPSVCLSRIVSAL